MVDKYFIGELKGPFHREARIKAGFSESELQYLEQGCGMNGRCRRGDALAAHIRCICQMRRGNG